MEDLSVNMNKIPISQSNIKNYPNVIQKNNELNDIDDLLLDDNKHNDKNTPLSRESLNLKTNNQNNKNNKTEMINNVDIEDGWSDCESVKTQNMNDLNKTKKNNLNPINNNDLSKQQTPNIFNKNLTPEQIEENKKKLDKLLDEYADELKQNLENNKKNKNQIIKEKELQMLDDNLNDNVE